jgi:HSP20 family protein
MKSQQALETPQTGGKPGSPASSPLFVEAEKLIERMGELTQAVAKRAYEFFETRGRQLGHELEDWFRAESELLRFVPVEMKEDENQFTVRAEVPGFKPGEIKISAEPRRLIIEGGSEQSSEEKSEKVVFTERRSDQFCRSLRIPVEIDSSKVTATLKDGILNITLPKAPARQAVGVEVKTV